MSWFEHKPNDDQPHPSDLIPIQVPCGGHWTPLLGVRGDGHEPFNDNLDRNDKDSHSGSCTYDHSHL